MKIIQKIIEKMWKWWKWWNDENDENYENDEDITSAPVTTIGQITHRALVTAPKDSWQAAPKSSLDFCKGFLRCIVLYHQLKDHLTSFCRWLARARLPQSPQLSWSAFSYIASRVWQTQIFSFTPLAEKIR